MYGNKFPLVFHFGPAMMFLTGPFSPQLDGGTKLLRRFVRW